MKVLFLTGKLQGYRIPIFEEIVAKSNIELTVAHSDKAIIPVTSKIKEVILEEKKIWKFTKHRNDFLSFCDQFDVVVAMFYIQKISFMRLLFRRKRKYKIIYWGIGVKASLNSNFDSPTALNKLRYFIARRADAMIFYSDYAKSKYINEGIDHRKLFVMQNTVQVHHSINRHITKDRILFIGTLYRAKKIFSLLESYHRAHERINNLPHLDIIGDGKELTNIQKWLKAYNLEKKITLHGAIYDENTLELFFKQSLATISPGQAGLSVLKSMGYGVPFITMRNSITGGERLNIENGYNGLLYEDDEQLDNIIIDIAINKKSYIQLGKNAKEYYDTKRSPEIMAKGFIDAVQYTTRQV